MKDVVIVRNRGQITIPDSIRKEVGWVNPKSAVSISVVKSDEIVMKPHQYKKEIDWDKLWKQIKRVRSFQGKGSGNLSAFISEDREKRR